MFTKIFKKEEAPVPTKLAPAPKPTAPKQVAPEVAAEWRGKFQKAVGDDAALLALATETPLLDIKQAAVQAIHGEETLKAAEREFRSHDRRVHRLAKQRYETAIAQRETRAKAAVLIESATALLADENIPANRLVDLDRAWHELDKTLIDAVQHSEYQARWSELTALTRGRGDQQLVLSRWSLEAEQQLRHAVKISAEVKAGLIEQPVLATAATEVQAALSAAPEGDTQALVEELQAMLVKLADLDAMLTRQAALKVAEDQANAQRQQAKSENTAAKAAKTAALTKLVVDAETSLAEGHLAETNKHLVALDAAVEKAKSVPSELSKRIETVQAEYARLKGWQHWGGGRVRDDLVLEAEALAQRTVDPAQAAKLPIKQHSDAIDGLRERWKELDKLGGATSRALWLRFDTALKAAYVPVGAHLAKLKAARQENLEARNKLVASLDTVVVNGPAAQGAEEGAKPNDWRELARALEHFNAEWRKLGPLEHTVPHKAREALVKRMDARIARIEAPLTEARRIAQLQREKFIARAKALATDTNARDTVTKVRDLQNEWQQHAKTLPLARGVENALWTEFKTATDAVFKQRDAAMSARESEWGAQRAAREALIDKLRALNDDSPTAEIKRTVFDVDSAWRKAGEVARKDAPHIEQRYRTARDAAQKLLSNSATRAWRKVVDALEAKVALCQEQEGSAAAEDLDGRWNALGALPAVWEKALGARRTGAQALKQDAFNTVLLQLESALDVDTPAAFQASRRDLKLLAMKNAIEARQAVSIGDADIARWLGQALGQRCDDATARTRVQAIVMALRGRPLSV